MQVPSNSNNLRNPIQTQRSSQPVTDQLACSAPAAGKQLQTKNFNVFSRLVTWPSYNWDSPTVSLRRRRKKSKKKKKKPSCQKHYVNNVFPVAKLHDAAATVTLFHRLLPQVPAPPVDESGTGVGGFLEPGGRLNLRWLAVLRLH